MRKLAVLAGILACWQCIASASSSTDAAVNALFNTREFKEAAISPDGKRVAWVEAIDSANPDNSTIYVEDVGGAGAAQRISADKNAPHDEHGIAWSPDSSKLAFLSDAEKPGQLQLYVAEASGSGITKLTSVTGFLAAPAWSPDGSKIAILFTENATRAAGPLVAETPETGEIKEAVTEQRLAIVDVATRQLQQISPADMYVYEYDWSPDGKRFAVIAAHGNGDNNWYVAQLYTTNADGGSMKSIYKPPLQIANPAWSPDGRKIAFIGGLMSDEGSVGGDVFTVEASGGEATNLTPGMKASASWLAWTSNGKILFSEFLEGDVAISEVGTPGHVQLVWRGPEHAAASDRGLDLSIAHDGKTSAAIRSSFGKAPELWAGEIGKWKQITHENAAQKPAWGEAKTIHWKSDSFDVQGWLVFPADFDSAKKYPLVVRVHGGPSSAVLSSWPERYDYSMALPANGYFLLMPNPRGSYGEGEAFTRANVKDFGGGDFRDIMAGVDEAIRVAPIDPNRLGITGWSYGGYMSMWAVTQTNRFKAAMVGAGLSDWQSYYGENLIDQWMIPFFGASVYDDPAVYAKSAPMTFIKNVKTPTLMQVGDSDGECPAPQSYEFWHALKTLGVETQLVVYEDEGHVFSNPKHQREVIDRTISWFDAHLK
ncbi:MAG TPA: S9 family peptidase [Candidatus Sulfotelmatobacter sp.]|nr:S9 family peptidase [Candidatus Sulfotelmatobacter sp.]